MAKSHRAYFNGHVGYYSPDSGRVRFGDKIFPNITTAIRYLSLQ